MIVQVNGRKLGYEESGYGEAIVFIHGFPHDRSLWSQQRVALASRARCITPDLAGFGESAPVASTSMESYADDIFLLLDHLEIDRATIAGLSMGGYIALACWRKYASRIDGMILCDTRATADNDAAKAKRNEAIALVEREGVAALAAQQITGMVGKRTREQNPALQETMMRMMSRQSREGVIAALAALRDRPDSTSTLGTMTARTLIVVGEDDVITPPSDSRAMLEMLPKAARAQLDIIAGAGHVSCVERPAAVTRAIVDYLAL